MPHPLLIGYIVGYIGLHSLLASLPFKAWVQRWAGAGAMRWYRLAYNLVAAVLLLPLPILLALLPDVPLYRAPEPFNWVLLAGQLAALGGLLYTLRHTDLNYFMGLAQLRQLHIHPPANTIATARHSVDPDDPDPSAGDDALITTGIYGWVRHPLYFFSILLIWLSPVMSANLLALNILLTMYMYIGSYHEEHRLLRIFGAEYHAYQQRVPRLVPRVLAFGKRPSAVNEKEG
ncbi:MAG: isoprenylcysteine carboxylmethyltransferase family protein [Chloroflexaceae bacterium]|nr:isoprenylcysteine carboxylmethyltransferase family protein [Chloroflexaceae bacterium]